jgi:geranylgeranyl reductase family protein
VIDKRGAVGEPVQCAGYVPKFIRKEVSFDKGCVIQEVDRMKTCLPSGDRVEMGAPGYMLDRRLFDRDLASAAVEVGADISLETVALSLWGGVVLAKRKGEKIEIGARVIIGADGPKSTVGQWINQVNSEFISAVQVEITLNERMDCTEVYFDLEFTGGYGWLFPRGRKANVGVGVNIRSGRRPMDALRSLLGKLEAEGRVEIDKELCFIRGLIPVNGDLRKTHLKNMLLVGDAGGQANPMTGAGIFSAVCCGRMAGSIAAGAIKRGKPTELGEYEVQWHELFGDSLRRAQEKRKYLDSHWNEGEFELALRKTWMAFG